MAAGGLPIVTPLARIRLPTISQLQAAINKQSLNNEKTKIGKRLHLFWRMPTFIRLHKHAGTHLQRKTSAR